MKTAISMLSIFLLTSFSNQATTNSPGTATKNVNEIKEVENIQLVTAPDTTFTFDGDRVGKMPSGWSNYFTGKGKLGKWEIQEDNSNKVLAQTSKENFGYHFDVIVNNELNYKDLEITVKFKGAEGNDDQGGGPVWRYQDADNYYIARANPLENNYRVYKLINGNRKQLKSVDLEINTGQWCTLKITMKGNEINCYFDGELKLETTDDSFPNAGKIGLWTKADAVTYFDDFKVMKINK